MKSLRLRGLFLPPVAVAQVPNDLVDRFEGGTGAARLLALLRFLSPLSVTLREGRGSKVNLA